MQEYLELFTSYLQNSLVQAFLYIIGAVLAAKLVDWIIISFLSRLVKRTDSTIDDKIIIILHRPIYYTILFMGLGTAVHLFQLPEIVTYSLLGIFKTISVIIWSLALFQSFMHFINWYSRKSKNNFIQVYTIPIFDNVGKVVIFTLALYFILVSWGINVTGLLASATVLSLTLAFAARDTVANLFSGFFIMADRPYKKGDYINLEGGQRGMVTTIGLRSTRIMTRDDIEITIPNSLIANSKIVNESGGKVENERVRIDISVAYGSDIDKVREILLGISNTSENVCENPDPRVRFRNFGDSGLMFQLLFWIEKPKDRGRIVDEINTNIYKIFNEENIVIPYPQRDIHVISSDPFNTNK